MTSSLWDSQRVSNAPTFDWFDQSQVRLRVHTTYDKPHMSGSRGGTVYSIPMEEDVALSYVKHVTQVLVCHDPDTDEATINSTLRRAAEDWYRRSSIDSEGSVVPPADIDIKKAIEVPDSWKDIEISYDTGGGGLHVNTIDCKEDRIQDNDDQSSHTTHHVLSTAHEENLQLVGKVLRVYYDPTKHHFVSSTEPQIKLCHSALTRGIPDNLVSSLLDKFASGLQSYLTDNRIDHLRLLYETEVPLGVKDLFRTIGTQYLREATKCEQLRKVKFVPDHWHEITGYDLSVPISEENFDQHVRNVLELRHLEVDQYIPDSDTVKEFMTKTGDAIVSQLMYKRPKRSTIENWAWDMGRVASQVVQDMSRHLWVKTLTDLKSTIKLSLVKVDAAWLCEAGQFSDNDIEMSSSSFLKVGKDDATHVLVETALELKRDGRSLQWIHDIDLDSFVPISSGKEPSRAHELISESDPTESSIPFGSKEHGLQQAARATGSQSAHVS